MGDGSFQAPNVYISRLPDVSRGKSYGPAQCNSKAYAIGQFHIKVAIVRTAESKPPSLCCHRLQEQIWALKTSHFTLFCDSLSQRFAGGFLNAGSGWFLGCR